MIEISKRQTILDVEVITRDTKVLENASKSMVLCPQHGTSISLRIFYFLSCFRLEHVYYQNAKKSIFFCLPVGSQIKCAQTYMLPDFSKHPKSKICLSHRRSSSGPRRSSVCRGSLR